MKKPFKIVFTVLFFLICALPLALLPFFKNDASLEKRAPAAFPAYVEGGKLNQQFSDQFEAWFNDALPLRAKLLTAANVIKGELLHAETSNVVVGKKGWLFFASETPDYTDANALTDAQLKAMAVTLSLMQEQVEANGGRFAFVPVPNKSAVYGEYMPSRYRQAQSNNLTRLTAVLREYDVSFTDMLGVLSEHKEQGVYLRRDSHWNYRGALLGCNAIMETLGRPHETHENAAFTVERNWRGDLDKLLYPAGGVMDEQVYYDIAHAEFVFTQPKGVSDTKAQLESFMSDKEERDDLFTAENKELPNGGALFMARDSFGRALLPYMIDCYRTSTFKRTDCPDIAHLAPGTDLVYEIAQRNLSRVISTAPFMYAPQRENVSADGLALAGAVSVNSESAGYGARVYGAFPEDASLGDGRVYLLLSGENGTFAFEAFPIHETKLLEEEGLYGYSAILSPELGLAGEYEAAVIAGGKLWQGGYAFF